jgi:hypothetical protein
MENHEKKIRIVIEIMQWVLTIFALFACLFICPNMKQHFENDKEEKLYKQINIDQKIERLNRENLMLIDSLANMKRDTVYIYSRKKK